MTTKKFEIGLKYSPDDLLGILKQRASDKGWSLSGDTQQGNFSDSWGVVSGAYEVRGNTAFVTIECGMDSLWPRIERELNDFFG